MESHGEMTISTLQDYMRSMGRLKRSPHPVIGFAPHKPFLLLAVIALIEKGEIDKNRILLSDDLIAIFKKYIALTPGWNPTIYNPFYRLKNEGFWHLRRWRGTNPPTSVRQLQRVGAYAVLDDALFDFLKIPVHREIIRQTLIDRYFPELRQAIEYLTVEPEAEEYSEQLIQGTQHPFSMHRDIESIQVETPVRSAGFRKAIMRIYDYKCAVCELDIRTASGASITDAAHIIPFSVSYNDDVRNGLSLCKSHHWAFDAKLFSLNETYQVIIPPISREHKPTERMLSELCDKRIWTPPVERHCPDQEALAWHREAAMRR